MLHSYEPTNKTCVLVEGPAWPDAEFYGRWLLSAAKTNELLQQARTTADLRVAIDTLEVDIPDSATTFVSKLAKELVTFTINENLEVDFIFMVELGFFVLTGDRYQMTLPRNLDMDRVKQAALKFAGIPRPWPSDEHFVALVPREYAKEHQRLLGDMNQDQRIASRRVLLGLESVSLSSSSERVHARCVGSPE